MLPHFKSFERMKRAVCDGALPAFRDQPLAVVGGGDSALEEASYLTKFASKVYVIHRRDAFRASKAMQKRIFDAPNAEVLWNKTVIDVLGEDVITGVLLKDTFPRVKRGRNGEKWGAANGTRPNDQQ